MSELIDPIPLGYPVLLETLKTRIGEARVRAALAVNSELVLLYWSIGREILERQNSEGWGAKVIDRLAKDLQTAFPDQKGFSPRNIKYMRAFADTYPDLPIVQQVAAQLPWFHNCVLMDKVKDSTEREWYARAAIQNGWSRNVLVHQIESRLYHRQGNAVTNFERTLPAPQSDLAAQILKDPYNFDFLTLGDAAHERDLERALTTHIRDFLLELGAGFAFVGSQHHLEVAGEDFYLDLLFYHLELRAFVVIDLKMGDFKPEYAGKMQFYLAAADDLLRKTGDAPAVGIILCRGKNRVLVEYTLRDTTRPIGVSEYRLGEALPETLRGTLPTIEELEAGLSRLIEENE
jgi:predicted nuclease of restriction endonuclease-like (RecB) superfamily